MLQSTKIILLFALTICCAFGAFAQVADSVSKPVDSLKSVKPANIEEIKPMSRRDSMKAKYVNPGKVAGRKAIFRSMIIPGWGQLYNMQILNDGYGTRAGKSQTFQKIYTGAKIAAIYGGLGALTAAYISNRKNYKIFLRQGQIYEEIRLGTATTADLDQTLIRYNETSILNAKSTYKRNYQIVIFSYGLVYFANIVDAYVAARLHFFNIDDNLSFKITPSVLPTNSMYGMNLNPALKLSLTF